MNTPIYSCRKDTVARASLVVEEGPSELLNRVVPWWR